VKCSTGKAGIGLSSSVEQSSVVFVSVFGNGSGWKRSVVSCVVLVKEKRRRHWRQFEESAKGTLSCL